MADTDRDGELPQRVPGATQATPPSPVALALPAELRQRLQAAVKAELAQTAEEQQSLGEDGTTGFPERINGSARRPAFVPEPQPAHEAEPADSAESAPEPDAAVWWGPEKTRRRVTARLAAVGLAAIVVIGSLAAVAVYRFSSSVSPSAVQAQAAAWVAEQVSPDLTVSCDAVMCAALEAHRFPVSKLSVLGPTSPEPLTSAVVVETATVRQLFGTSLAQAWAPAVLASFGSGAAAITVRVVAPHGAATYQAAHDAELAISKTAGAKLLQDPGVAVSATARSQLLAGQIDLRLVGALTSVAGREPINIVQFGNLGPGAGYDVPLDFADLAEAIPAAHMDTAAYARAVWAVLDGPDTQIRPARAISGPVQGQPILRIEFSAPSPLGNISPESP